MKYFIVVILFLTGSILVTAQTANWSAVLPEKFPTNISGQIHGISRVSQMKFHPSNQNIMYAVSACGGLFISSDGGNNWTVSPGTERLPFNNLASVCIDSDNDQNIYIGTGDHNYYSAGMGVWKSTDGGNSFYQTSLTNKLVIDMVTDPSDPTIIVAITDAGIYKTTDAGSTWTLKTSTFSFDDLKQKTAVSRVLYASTRDSAFFRSTDFGDTWLQITNGIILPAGVNNGNGCRIAVTPADSNIVYLGMVTNGGIIYKSIDGGSTFSLIKNAGNPYLTYYSNSASSSGQGDYNFGLGIDRVDPNIIYLVSHNVWKSLDAGSTWHQLTNWYEKIHTDMHQMTVSPFNSDQLWNMNDGGVWLSTDGGNNWVPRSDGIYGYEIYHGNCSPTLKDMHSIGTQDNGELYANSMGWVTNRGGDWSSQCAFDYRPGSSMVYYFDNRKRRLVNGVSATYGLPGGTSSLQDITFHRSNPDLAFAGDSIIYRSLNLTQTNPVWVQLFNFQNNIVALHSNFSDANKLYVITQNGIFHISTNALSSMPTFTSIVLPISNISKASITSIKTAPNTIYITCNTQTFYSVDNGATWKNITYNLPSVNHVRILADEFISVNELVFLASDNAVYFKVKNAMLWTPYVDNLPSRSKIVDMSVFNDGTANTRLRVATYGRGMWETGIDNLRVLSASFEADQENPCIGEPVLFSDISTGYVVSYLWTFPGGTPASSTAEFPQVTYQTFGNYDVSLTVSDGNTISTKTKTRYISTNGTVLPVSEGFEGLINPPPGWKYVDNSSAGEKWVKTNITGGYANSAHSMKFNNFSWNIPGEKDELLVKRLDLTGYSNAQLSFDLAYQVYSGYSDTLAVLISTDCGQSYNRIYLKGGTMLSTAGSSNSYFVPASTQWRTEHIDISNYVGQQTVTIAFQNINGYGNVLYLDNVNITGTPIATNVYKFTGNGHWDIASNWLNNMIPPVMITGNEEIIIDPTSNGECILNILQQVTGNARITVKAGKKFRINGNLTITQ